MSEDLFILWIFVSGWFLLLGVSYILVAALSRLGAWLTGEKCWQDWAAGVMEGKKTKRNAPGEV